MDIDTKSLAKDINTAKDKLIKQYKTKGLCENFGQEEVNKLHNKYGRDYTWERKTKSIDDFNNWCINFTGKELN